MDLKGKAALVTGAGRRIGRAIALELGRAGCDVAVHYRRSREEAESVTREIEGFGRRAVAVAGDLNCPADWPGIVEAAAGAFGRLDVLVNNASQFLTASPDTVEAFDPGVWDEMLRTNLTAPMGLCHYARGHLSRHGSGRIVQLSDISAQRPWSDHLAYCASKAGLDALTKALARSLAPDVLVNAVALGIGAFPESYPPELRRRLIGRVPLGREAALEEVARVVRFLVEEGDYITGEIIQLDGGRHLV